LTVSSKLYGGVAVTSTEYAFFSFKVEHCTYILCAGIKKALLPCRWVFKREGVAF
jgi:hypothetical protein